MKLSTVLSFRERVQHILAQQDCFQQWSLLHAHLQEAMDIMVDSVPGMPHLAEAVNNSQRGLTAVNTALQETISWLDAQIQHKRAQYLEQNQSIYAEDQERLYAIMKDSTKPLEAYWQHRVAVIAEESALIKSHIASYDDWRLPGMMLGPAIDGWIEHMVALDPLYLVDRHLDMLVPAVRRFPKVYQRRLRRYEYNEGSVRMLADLPQRQMGLVLAFDFFSIKPLPVIERYLAELFDLLRDGGACIFTFVDGDRAVGAELVEKRMACFVPAQDLRDMCAGIGYETVFEYQSPRGWNLYEIKRPGVVSSRRGGQALATIVPIT